MGQKHHHKLQQQLTYIAKLFHGPFTQSISDMSVISLMILLQLIAYRFLNTPSKLLQNGFQCQIDLERVNIPNKVKN